MCTLTPCGLCSESLTKGSRPPVLRCCAGVLLGNFFAIAMKISLTFMAVLADVSMNNKLFSSAYTWASCRIEGLWSQHTYIQHNHFSHSSDISSRWMVAQILVPNMVSSIAWPVHAKTYPTAGRKDCHVLPTLQANYSLHTTFHIHIWLLLLILCNCIIIS